MSSNQLTPKIPSSRGSQPRMLPFLRALLDDESYSNIICWVDKSTLEFRLVDTKKVAELWGATKENRKRAMTYDTMSRAMRDFITKDKTLEKIQGRTCGYRFLEPSVTTSSTTHIQRGPLFSIENILAGETHRRSSLNLSIGSSSSGSSPTSSAASSGTPTSSTSSGSPTSSATSSSPTSGSSGPFNTSPLLPTNPTQMAQFNAFIAHFSLLQGLPRDVQMEYFNRTRFITIPRF